MITDIKMFVYTHFMHMKRANNVGKIEGTKNREVYIISNKGDFSFYQTDWLSWVSYSIQRTNIKPHLLATHWIKSF